jgi:putative type II/III system pilus formation protein
MRLSCVRLFALGLFAAVGIGGPLGAAEAADINVILDQARLVKLPDRVATIVVGNPVIADAAVQSGGWMVITGKGYGTTNLIALDRSGAVLMEKTIEVQGPQNVVVVYRGVDRDTYSCTPDCSRQLALGDSQAFFEVTAGQITARNGLAAGTVQSR